MNKYLAKFLISLLTVLTVFSATRALATIELRSVNARQAYVDIFFNKSVAQLISEEATQHNINPRLVLVMLQRESAAITQSTPSSTTRQSWPLFYNYDERMANCLNGDEASCNDSKYGKPDYSFRAENYGGVGQQIAYAIAQLRNLAGDGISTNGTYCDGSRVVSVDGQDITADNVESCALYKYTPHAVSYDTSSAFYTNWVAWEFGGTPNGGEYSPTNIISQANFSNAAPMTADEINNWLVAKGSWLANYIIPEYISIAYPAVAAPPAPPAPPTPQPPAKGGDCNRDGSVDSTDLSILADSWGKGVDVYTSGDLNGDATVDSTDLSILADGWGK